MAYDPRLRMQFFTGQFLEEQDFNDLQDYHLDRQRRHNKTMHTPGIADGLDVNKGDGQFQIKITPGTAIDSEGRQIVVPSDISLPLDSFKGKTVFIVVSYKEEDMVQQNLQDGKPTRKIETANIEVLESTNGKPLNLFIQLASIEVSDNSINIKKEVRVNAGAKGAGAELIKKLDDHINNKQNPHGVTPAQIGALPLIGGTVKGAVQIDAPGKLDVLGRGYIKAKVAGTYDPSGDKDISTKGTLFVVNTEQKSYGLVAKVSFTDNDLPQQKLIPPAAVVALSSYDNVHGIYTTAKQGTHALNVEGTVRITGQISTTHIVDTFINASGQRLRTGDVVKLKGTPVTKFRGLQNKAPVAEVTLADQENDTLVIGIVDCEAIPEPGVPDTRVEPEDPSFIENGGELYLVTLGVFAHCKVDATEAPIQVGDLLTTSKNPGHAKKATEPKLGSIIGKALQPLKKGTGVISVFVNIQ